MIYLHCEFSADRKSQEHPSKSKQIPGKSKQISANPSREELDAFRRTTAEGSYPTPQLPNPHPAEMVSTVGY